MSQNIMLELPDATADWLRTSAQRTGRSVNALSVSVMEEFRRTSEFPDIEFRTFNGERHACLQGLLQIWQVIQVAQGYDMDAHRLAAHFGWPVALAQSALAYYAAFPDEINVAIAENRASGYEHLKQLFPQMSVTEVSVSPQDSDVSEGAA